MAAVTHTFQTAIPDDGTPAGGVGSDEWNAGHTLTGIDPSSAYLGTLTLSDGQFILQLSRIVLQSTDRLTLQGTARLVNFGSTDAVVPNVIGFPFRPTTPVRIPSGYANRWMGRLRLEDPSRLIIEGDGEAKLFDDAGQSRVILTGRG
jgi:hypothetical protein